MKTVLASKARDNFYKLIADAASSHEPIMVVGKRGNAVLMSEEDWNSAQETMYLLSIPGMREKLHKGLKEPKSKRVPIEKLIPDFYKKKS